MRVAKEQVLEKRKQLQVEKENEELSLKLKKKKKEYFKWNGTIHLLVSIKNKSRIMNINLSVLNKIILLNFIDKFKSNHCKNLILNPNYKRYSKNEFHQEPEQKVQQAQKNDQEKRSGNDYDSPPPF